MSILTDDQMLQIMEHIDVYVSYRNRQLITIFTRAYVNSPFSTSVTYEGNTYTSIKEAFESILSTEERYIFEKFGLL